MAPDTLNKFWLLVTFLLIIIIIVSGFIIWNHRDNGQQIQITLKQPSESVGELSIEGAVLNPGTYPLKPGDSFDSIIEATGGIVANADLSRMHLFIPQTQAQTQPQKVNINRAEIWLLQALPGIGETRAKAIIDYRIQNGPFQTSEDITNVPGIGEATFEQLKSFITVIEE
jgi:competence protein ComEA